MTLRTSKLNILVALVFLLSNAGCDLFFVSSHPSDDELLRNFQTYEAGLNRLVIMSNEDARVIRIAPDFTRLVDNWSWPRPESEIGLSRQRWDEYRSLFSQLELPVGLERFGQSDEVLIQFPVSTRGLGVSGSAKGYAYSERELFPLLDSLDEESVKRFYERERPEQSIALYRRIRENWYLFLD